MPMRATVSKSKTASKVAKFDKQMVLDDYKLALESRHASILGRKEVFMGNAKFGIFGDGKEVAQLALAKIFKQGDWRSGYYRDQTWLMALRVGNLSQFFAQLYAHADVAYEPCTGGRLMNVHYGSRSLDENGEWLNQLNMHNSTTDMSPTSIQMPRLLGLAYASKLYRNIPDLQQYADNFSLKGNEIAFGSIGDGACAEGIFYETINAAGVLQVPMLVSVWDDHYAISVHRSLQTTKVEISKALEGFQRTDTEKGIEIIKVKGWDYEALIHAYRYAESVCREEHVPVLVHVDEVTQPQGHSTSGSHERYKSKERLEWEHKNDCIVKFREWILKNGFASNTDLTEIENTAKITVRKARDEAWHEYNASIKSETDKAFFYISLLENETSKKSDIQKIKEDYQKISNPMRMDAIVAVKNSLRAVREENLSAKRYLQEWLRDEINENNRRYSSHVYSESEYSPLHVAEIKPQYTANSPVVDGREVLNACFDLALQRDPRIFAIGEDVGRIGDVNQGFAGLQEKYGVLRVTDTGIRETTIIGQGIGCAQRGLRPICEIQYLDYLIYGLEPLCDDLASVHYRSKGGHKAPMIVRTRGHRLEGVWHSGSPIGMILSSLRGIYVCVPRNMIQAAGFYNTLLKSDNPALVVECLNTYRQKERMPANVGEFTVPLGVPEILLEGTDVTIVTYGAMCKIVLEAAHMLNAVGIHCEVIDVQSLIPFDVHHIIQKSIQKTNRVVFADEDVPGGATAYMMQQTIEGQNAYKYLDHTPVTITAQEHRPAYGDDGDYFSKPNPDNVFDKVYEIMNELNPAKFPELY
ncbi:MAG: thiamine pyrophosphate-dependent enzyme [Cytophagales bacterium]|nr:thiamine pyrophosphate-dependent enzyme [Cytophagales bacterium]